jgi:hypothetical protein
VNSRNNAKRPAEIPGKNGRKITFENQSKQGRTISAFASASEAAEEIRIAGIQSGIKDERVFNREAGSERKVPELTSRSMFPENPEAFSLAPGGEKPDRESGDSLEGLSTCDGAPGGLKRAAESFQTIEIHGIRFSGREFLEGDPPEFSEAERLGMFVRRFEIPVRPEMPDEYEARFRAFESSLQEITRSTHEAGGGLVGVDAVLEFRSVLGGRLLANWAGGILDAVELWKLSEREAASRLLAVLSPARPARVWQKTQSTNQHEAAK